MEKILKEKDKHGLFLNKTKIQTKHSSAFLDMHFHMIFRKWGFRCIRHLPAPTFVHDFDFFFSLLFNVWISIILSRDLRTFVFVYGIALIARNSSAAAYTIYTCFISLCTAIYLFRSDFF